MACGQMHQVHERPGIMIMNHVHIARQFRETGEGRGGKSGGSNLEVQFGAVCVVTVECDGFRMPFPAQRQDVCFNPERSGATGKLVDDLFDAADGVGEVGSVEVEDAH